MTATRPTLDEVAARLGVDPSDVDLAGMYDAAMGQQNNHCTVDPYTPELAEAFYRRVANLWTSKAHTLGVLDTGSEYGVQYVPRYDPMVDQLEGSARHIPIA